MRELLKVGDMVCLKNEYQGHIDKRGGKFSLYLIQKINRINVRAVNLATGGTFILKKDNIEIRFIEG